MKNIILTTILIFLGLQVYTQDLESILQKSVDFEPLAQHFKKNSIINFGHKDLIADNGIFPENIVLNYNSDTLKVNKNDGSKESFFDGYTFEFLKIKIRRKKAQVIYKYFPHWHPCEKPIGLGWSSNLYYLIDLKFEKQGEWRLISFKLNDIDKTKLSDCKRQKYIELK